MLTHVVVITNIPSHSIIVTSKGKGGLTCIHSLCHPSTYPLDDPGSQEILLETFQATRRANDYHVSMNLKPTMYDCVPNMDYVYIYFLFS